MLAKDLTTARALLAGASPGTLLAAPASAYWPIIGEIGGFLPALLSEGPDLDVVTWHYYPQESHRCPVAVRLAGPDVLLDPHNLDEITRWAAQVAGAARPGMQVWLDETSNAQCGGEPGVSDRFASSLWWLDELGLMARRGSPVVVRQTLTGANYGLLDSDLQPNPDYFATLLWLRLMGSAVLSASLPPSASSSLRVYAQCGRAPGAVTVLAINLSEAPVPLAVDGVAGQSEVYAVTAASLGAQQVALNGVPLEVAADGTPPPLLPATAGAVLVAARSYVFVSFPAAGAVACMPRGAASE